MSTKRSDVIKIEKRNSDKDLFEIRLIKEGDWYRAYDWSAYLCNNYKNEKLKDRLKPTHLKQKNGDETVFVGLQPKSFEKYLPKSVEPKTIENGIIVYDVVNYFSLIPDFNIKNYEDILKKWMEDIPIKETRGNPNKILNLSNIDDIPFDDDGTIQSIIKEILSIPLISINPIDALKYLSIIQRKLVKHVDILTKQENNN